MKTLKKKDCRRILQMRYPEGSIYELRLAINDDHADVRDQEIAEMQKAFGYTWREIYSSPVAEPELPAPTEQPAPEPDWRERFPVGQRVRVDFDPPYAVVKAHALDKNYPLLLSGPTVTGTWNASLSFCEPVAFVPGDLVSHPEHGEGFVHEDLGHLMVQFSTGQRINFVSVAMGDASKLTLIRKAPWSEVAQ